MVKQKQLKRMTSNDDQKDVDTEQKDVKKKPSTQKVDLKIVVENIQSSRFWDPEDLHSLITDLSLFCEKRLHFGLLRFT